MTDLPTYDPDWVDLNNANTDEPPDSFMFDMHVRGRTYRVAKITAKMLGLSGGSDPGCGYGKLKCLAETSGLRCSELPACSQAFYPEVTDETLVPIMALRMGVRDEPA